MRKFTLKKQADGGFGVTFRGNKPVFVRSVDFDSHAHSSGLRSGDLLVQFNGKNVRLVTAVLPRSLCVLTSVHKSSRQDMQCISLSTIKYFVLS